MTNLRRILAVTLIALAAAQSRAQAAPATPSQDPWWKHAVFYEIYPRSFQDTNTPGSAKTSTKKQDGIGDLNGITQRLDYLQHLGIDAIWIAPMYPSPQVDFGYDISNYTAIDPQYGTLADFDRLVAAARQHHIRIVLDMVLNHTSDKHSWFMQSATSRSNPKADWYIWNDGIPAPKRAATIAPGPNEHQGPNGWVVPPNNWSSLFQGSAWEWVPARGQFYYHFFYKQQPDLNWRNPAVEKAMFDAMRFWLDRGVAGFRLDAIDTLFEDPTLHNEPLTGKLDASGFPESNHTLTSNLPDVHDVLRRLRKLIDSYPDNRVLIGETYTANTAQLLGWYGTAAQPELHLPMDTLVAFHPEGDGITQAHNVALNLLHFRKYLAEMNTDLDGHQPLLVFDNHDNTRSWDRFTTPSKTPAEKLAIAKLIATILFTSRSADLMYYGQELGMTTETPTRKEDVRDPIGITGWPSEKGRDGERTPMQWTPGPQAGFSSNPDTWLPVPADHTTINVASETADPDSLLSVYDQLIALRRSNPVLRDGTTTFVDNTNPNVLSYIRTSPAGGKPVLVTLNFTGQPQTIALDLAKDTNIYVNGLTSLIGPHDLSDFACKNCSEPPMTLNLTLPPYASLVAEIKIVP